MNRFVRLLTCFAAFAGLLLLADGCSRHTPTVVPPPTPEERAAAEQRLQSDLNLVFARATDALAEGRTNEAIVRIEAAFGKRVFAAYRPQILDNLLQTMLRLGRVEDARRRAFAASTDQALSAGACGLLYRYYRESGDVTNALAWSAELAAHPGIPSDMRRQAFTWNIDDLIAQHNDDQALAVLGQSFQALTPAEGMSLVRFTIETLFGAGRPEDVEKVLTLAATLKTSAPELKHLTVATHVRVSSARGDWATLTNEFPAAVGILDDGELDGLLRTVVPAATKAGKRAVIDQCAVAVLFNPAAVTGKCASVATAARVWGENAMETDKGAFPGRLDAMLRAKVPAAEVINLFFRYFYSFTEQPVPLKELIALGERLVPLAGDADTRNDIKIKVLDGCFLVQDYDRALALVESGIPGPGRSPQWHTTAIVKIKAHRALLRHEPREAVKYFREFMDLLRATKDADISDPVSGLLFPKEMVLGRNAKRIGDILAGIPDPAESAQAYAEARELYEQALKNTKDAEASAVIKTEIEQLPKIGGR